MLQSFHARHPPDIVVYTQTAKEVAAVVKVCHDYHIPVVARGAGSGLEGGAIPYQGGVVINLMRMQNIKVCKDDMLAIVEPGVKKSQLLEYLRPYGLLFGPDPARYVCYLFFLMHGFG